MAHGKRNLRLEARWRALVARQSESGLGVRGFCQRERVTEASYYAWRRELRLRDQQRATPQPAFVPVLFNSPAASGHSAGITIELRGGRVLRVPPSLPVAHVAELVVAVEGAS